jgi:hypothetical protein
MTMKANKVITVNKQRPDLTIGLLTQEAVEL